MIRNIFACLVHESPECVTDLVRNLRFLDPSSAILLYDGGPPGLLRSALPLERYGAIMHPSPRPMHWGRLHDFALDCMRFALANLPFDSLTIVDSDQLATRRDYSAHLGSVLAGQATAGLFGDVPDVLPPASQIGPVPAAFQEFELWRPFLRRFPDGEKKFPYWSFWPATIFTADAARDLTRLFDSDPQLHEILSRSRIWATEEIILPTLTALLGYKIAVKPTSGAFVKYRAVYDTADATEAVFRSDVYWIHPVARRYDDPVRAHIRRHYANYVSLELPSSTPQATRQDDSLDSARVLERMRTVEGWLEDEEGELLLAQVSQAIEMLPAGVAMVEVGCFCGRATVVLGSVIKSQGARSLVYAIDSHDGRVGARDQGLKSFGETLDRFRRNIAGNQLEQVVQTIRACPSEVPWDRRIGFLLIDGLHDYASVERDFEHFEKWLVAGGYVAFHDYAEYYPGVQAFVNKLLREGEYRKVAIAKTMIVLTKSVGRSAATSRNAERPAVVADVTPLPRSSKTRPLVSCIMPTANRRVFLPNAIRRFLQQDYPALELIIVDDGLDSVADLIPPDERIRYIRLPDRRTMGYKHNLACEVASGEVVVHMDDDDWNATWRVSYQVEMLCKHPSAGLCGLSRVLFYEPTSQSAWEYIYMMPGRPWVYGATFCYHRDFWEQHRFPDMNEGADTTYVWNLDPAEVFALDDHRFLVATVHANNTSPKRTTTTGWQRRSSVDVRNVVDEDGWSFYEQLALTSKQATPLVAIPPYGQHPPVR